MPRRLRKSRPAAAPNPVEDLKRSLAASVAANRELRAELDAAEKRADAEQRQGDLYKAQMIEARTSKGVAEDRAMLLERQVESLTHRLTMEQKHTAGSCSHAADLRALTLTLTALERRVAELQAVNEGYEASGWQPSSMAMSGGKRGRG